MTGLVPIVMFGWVIVTIALFFRTSPQNAVLISVFGGLMFLPIANFNYPGLPAFTKSSIIALGLLFGEALSGSGKDFPLKLCRYDIPMILWCFISPLASALSNQVGLYNGLSEALGNSLSWGVFFWFGRRYFNDTTSIHKIAWSFVIGGLVYLPLILFELRMSPRLHRIIYGYFAHDWRQHFRYGGYRPIVFMEHGIMVALFMVAATLLVFWFWRSGTITKIRNVPVSIISLVLIVTTIFCRTAAGWFYLALGIGVYFYYKKKQSTGIIGILIIIIPIYILLRITNVISSESVQSVVSVVFDEERVESLAVRLLQEDLFSARALLRPLFGWGGMSRAWPVDPITGRRLIRMIDPLWVILFGRYGFFGLISAFVSLGLGPWHVAKIYRTSKRNNTYGGDTIPVDVMVLCLIVIIFMIDSLINAMVNQMYILCSGALISHYLSMKDLSLSVGNKKTVLR